MGLTFYTVQLEKEGYPVKYVASPTYFIQTFFGPFDDPGSASQEFQAAVLGECCYLNEGCFLEKARALASLRRDRKKLQVWKGGS